MVFSFFSQISICRPPQQFLNSAISFNWNKKVLKLFCCTLLGNFIWRELTIGLMKWLCFYMLVIDFALMHLAAFTFLIVWLLFSWPQADNTAHVIHVYKRWLWMLVYTNLLFFPHLRHFS